MSEQDKQRIEKEADEYYKNCDSLLIPYKLITKAYQRGATAEHELLKRQLEYADNYIQMVTEDRDKSAELLKTMEEYISLLSKGLADSASFLDAHRWTYSQSDIDKGFDLRAKIESLKSE